MCNVIKGVLCQKDNEKKNVSGTVNGKTKLINSAKILDDQGILTCPADALPQCLYQIWRPSGGERCGQYRRTIGR